MVLRGKAWSCGQRLFLWAVVGVESGGFPVDDRPVTANQPPAYLALIAILGGLFLGALLVLASLLLMSGFDLAFRYLSGEQAVPGRVYRVGTLVMVLGTGVGMILMGSWAERAWRRRNGIRAEQDSSTAE